MWGENIFRKTGWGSINLLVGANGTGKSLFAEQLKINCPTRLFRKAFERRGCLALKKWNIVTFQMVNLVRA
jgi:hypothetical protein